MSAFNGNEPICVDTKTHAVKQPVASNAVLHDLDFTGLIIIGLNFSGGLPLLLNKCRIMADGTFLLFNPDQNKYHPLQIRGVAGSEYITIGAGVS